MVPGAADPGASAFEINVRSPQGVGFAGPHASEAWDSDQGTFLGTRGGKQSLHFCLGVGAAPHSAISDLLWVDPSNGRNRSMMFRSRTSSSVFA